LGVSWSFSKAREPSPEAGPVLFKHETTSYKAQVGTASSTLFVAESPELPIAVSLKRGDKTELFLYSQYAQMEFDSKLFAKPADVKIQDSKP
jgi:hypothetical protein